MKKVDGQFQRWEPEDDVDAMASMALSPAQRAFIQNEMAIVNERILTLAYDPTNPMKFIQEDAGLKGQSAAFSFLLACSDRAQEFFAAARQDAASSPSSFPTSSDVDEAAALESLFPQN